MMKKLLVAALVASLTAFCGLATAQNSNLKTSGGNIFFDWSTVVQPQVIGSYGYTLYETYVTTDPLICYNGKSTTNPNDVNDAGNQITYAGNSSGGTGGGCKTNIEYIILYVESGTAAGKQIWLTDKTAGGAQANGCTGTIFYDATTKTLGFHPAYSTCTVTIS